MPKSMKRRAVLAKIETTYGTDPTPTGASNAIYIKNLGITPVAADIVDRDLVRPYMGSFDQMTAMTHVEVEFEVEAMGSGTAGTAPSYGALLRACGLSETVVASTSVTYAPVSTAFESCTIYVAMDGVQHKITGARGTFAFDLKTGQIPTFKFKFFGIYNGPTDTAVPSVTLPTTMPLVSNNTNTTPFSFYSKTNLAVESVSVDLGNVVSYRALIGTEYVLLSDRKVGGSIAYEAETIANLDIYSAARNNTTGQLSFTHGTVGGNKVAFAMTKVDVRNPAYADSNGVIMTNVDFVALPSSGNDELSIVFT